MIVTNHYILIFTVYIYIYIYMRIIYLHTYTPEHKFIHTRTHTTRMYMMYLYMQREQFGAEPEPERRLRTLPWRLREDKGGASEVVRGGWGEEEPYSSVFCVIDTEESHCPSRKNAPNLLTTRRACPSSRNGQSCASLANVAAVCHCPTAPHTAASWLVHSGTSAVRALQCRLTRWENRRIVKI